MDTSTTSLFLDDSEITDITVARTALKIQQGILKTIAELVEFRDSITGGHIERTQGYLGLLIGALIQNGIYEAEVDKWNIWLVLNSAQLHDIGKIAISDSILRKPGKLSDEEFEEIKKHTIFGENVIDRIGESIGNHSFLENAKIFAGTHHEKWDGSGYPRALKENDIPLQGRLMAFADVYDAIISERPYKKAISHEQAVEIISKGRGGHFDPILTDVFLDVSDEFKIIADKYKQD